MQLLSFESQIFYMKFKGIKFNLISEFEAMKILEFNNYYFKLSNYKSNFIVREVNYQNNKVEKFIDLDFKHLVDLSSLDMQLRYILMKLCLDIEHSIKLMIMREFTKSNNDDGNVIINDFFSYIKNTTDIKKPYRKFLKHVKQDSYLNAEYIRYSQNKPLWFVVEHMQFGSLCWLVEYLYNEKQLKLFKELSETLRMVKNIRNKVAHNSPILDDIVVNNQLQGNEKNKLLVEYTKKTGMNKKIIKNRMTNFKTHDLVALLYVYDKVVMSSAMKSHRKQELYEFMKRAKRNREIYDNRFISVYNFFDKILAIF